MISKKEGMILCFKFCSVALNASFCLKKRKLRKNKSEVFRVKIPQRKVTKFKTQNHSFFFALSVIPTSIYQRYMVKIPVKIIPPIYQSQKIKTKIKKQWHRSVMSEQEQMPDRHLARSDYLYRSMPLFFYFRLYFCFLNIFNTAAICFLNAIAAAATTRINTAYRKYHDTL